MKRIALTDGSGRWFDANKAEEIKEITHHDGRNMISRATGSQFEHESLYRTAGGKWILCRWSQYQGSTESYNEITNQEAAEWMAKQEMEPHEDCAPEFAALEIE